MLTRVLAVSFLTALAAVCAPKGAAALERLALSSPGAALVGADVPQDEAKAARLKKVLAGIKLPPGFSIDLFALTPDARGLALHPGGETVLVSTNQAELYVLRDTGAGVAASVRRFLPNADLRMPHGICFAPDGALYIAEQNRVLTIQDIFAAPGSEAAAPHVVVARGALIPRSEESGGHSARICRIGPDDRLYVSLGQPYNVSPPEKTGYYQRLGIGGILSMKRDGSDRRVHTTGIRNSVGMDFNPKDGLLWFTDNQVDGMGDLIPPGELNRQTAEGQNFGFPWYGGGHTRTREYASAAAPENLVFPEVEMDAHAADLGMRFYTGAMFPEKYRGAIFSAQHGSWDRSTPIGARIMVTYLKPDGHADKAEPFTEGCIAPAGGYLCRPVDTLVLKDGSLLVSDDQSGAVYRISFRP